MYIDKLNFRWSMGSARSRRSIPMLDINFTLELWAKEAVPNWYLVRAFMKDLAAERLSKLSIQGTKLEQNDVNDTATHLYNQSNTSIDNI